MIPSHVTQGFLDMGFRWHSGGDLACRLSGAFFSLELVHVFANECNMILIWGEANEKHSFYKGITYADALAHGARLIKLGILLAALNEVGLS